jgi:DNA helicase-2/ATP-dependent DNA helicase PcrA
VLQLYENPLYDIHGSYPEEIRVIEEYAFRLRQNNAVDLDKLIEKTNHLFMTHPEALCHYQKTYTHVFVDEFQDTSDDQMQLLDFLHPQNLFVVGDDFQAIYGWRKARVEYIIHFADMKVGCEVIKLEDNYRSTHQIVEGANRVISFNVNQTRKTLRAHKSGDNILVLECDNVHDESERIIRMLKAFVDKGLHYSDIAILTRTNAQISRIKGVMDEIGLPAIVVSGDDEPFKKSDI